MLVPDVSVKISKAGCTGLKSTCRSDQLRVKLQCSQMHEIRTQLLIGRARPAVVAGTVQYTIDLWNHKLVVENLHAALSRPSYS